MGYEAVLVQSPLDTIRPLAERNAAAEASGQLRAASYTVWRALCVVVQDGRDDAEARWAAVRAIGVRNPALAPNQLCRYVKGDTVRQVRAEAVAMLKRLGPDLTQVEPQRQRDLNAIRQGSA